MFAFYAVLLTSWCW